ncbi:hypothetical protein [Nocardioides euryhalodurans]|uniref:Sulfotransferase family protein n=1 Tax=Nocardioides euryhalodurans TaxID=2518370 RepID=A0A4P7GIW7_9ACTN|nr:hypothetical protein [Nocardioides euryhalodurans]QBR91940.1 hypothetical protein EXE57_06355 [Nocardioides euryhalodurans]
MTPRPLFLHIGTRKSGTTSLQGALKTSRPALLAEGVNHPFNSRPQHMKKVLAPMLALGVGDGEEGRQGIRELVRTLRDAPGDRLLLTLEDLAEMPEEPVAHLLAALSEDFEVHVVITARDWSKQIPSEWQQLVKSRLTLPYGDFATAVREERPEVALFRQRQHLPGIARRWSQGLPPEHVHVIAVPSPKREPMGLYELFAGLVGYDPAALEVSRGSWNTSLGYEQAEMLRQVNVALGDRLSDVRGEYRPVVRRLLINGALRKQEPGRSLGLPAGDVAWVTEESQRMLDELRAAGHEILGDPQDLLPAEGGRTMDLEVDPDEVARVAVQALADVVVRSSRADEPAAQKPQPKARPRSGAKTAAPRPAPAGPARRAVRRARRLAGRVKRRLAR